MVGEHPLFFLAKRMESSASGEGRRVWQSSSLVDALRNQFAGPSKEMMDTIIVAQNQVKDGFLAVGQW